MKGAQYLNTSKLPRKCRKKRPSALANKGLPPPSGDDKIYKFTNFDFFVKWKIGSKNGKRRKNGYAGGIAVRAGLSENRGIPPANRGTWIGRLVWTGIRPPPGERYPAAGRYCRHMYRKYGCSMTAAAPPRFIFTILVCMRGGESGVRA